MTQKKAGTNKKKRTNILEVILDEFEKKEIAWTTPPTELPEGKWTIKVQQSLYDEIGKTELNEQVLSLQGEGLLLFEGRKGGWYSYGSELEEIRYSPAQILCFYKRIGRRPKYDVVQELKEEVERSFGVTLSKELRPWIKETLSYVYEEMLRSLAQHGKIRSNLMYQYQNRELYIKTLFALNELDEPMIRHIFSSKYLGDSKIFDAGTNWNIQNQIIADARKFHPDVLDDKIDDKYIMSNDEVLEQIYIETYHQELAIKGDLRFFLADELVETGKFRYGLVLNAQTLKHAVLDDEQHIKKIVTIENKANFVATEYEEGTLFVYSHGFFSPKERKFLQNLRDCLKEKEVTYYHSSDLDYGGLRIFIDIKQKIFPELRPLYMDRYTYEKYMNEGENCSDNYLEKVRKLEVPEELQELKSCIVEYGKVIEQECLLYH